MLTEQLEEAYGPYILKCPECEEFVETVPAEGVPDQQIRGCPNCGEIFWQTDTVELSQADKLGCKVCGSFCTVDGCPVCFGLQPCLRCQNNLMTQETL